MKYFLAISCILAYVAAFQDLGAPKEPCACLTPLQDVYKQISAQVESLKDVENRLTWVDKTVVNVDERVEHQGEVLVRVRDDLKAFVHVENSTSVILNEQSTDLKKIFYDLCDVCDSTEDLEELAGQQTCILESLEKIAVAAVEDCSGVNCQVQIGSVA